MKKETKIKKDNIDYRLAYELKDRTIKVVCKNIIEEINIFLLKIEKNKIVNIPDINNNNNSKKEYLISYKDYLNKIINIINDIYYEDYDLNEYTYKELYEKYIID